jgi:hypothetical protein
MTHVERLKELHSAFVAAGGPTEIVALTSAALAANPSEEYAAATNAHVEARSAVKETLGLAAVGKELAEDTTPPKLYGELTIARPTDRDLTPDRYLATDGAIRFQWRFWRASEADAAGAPIAARLLVPSTGIDWRLVEALPRSLGRLGLNITPVAAKAPRRALLAAAVERAAKNK